jgi:3-methyladenine DNA glycosylase AlkC
MNYNQKLAAAQDLNTPIKTLELLATDKDSDVRYCVANNPNTPIKTLELLATDEDDYVRHSVAQNPNRNELIERLVFMTDYQLGLMTDYQQDQ